MFYLSNSVTNNHIVNTERCVRTGRKVTPRNTHVTDLIKLDLFIMQYSVKCSSQTKAELKCCIWREREREREVVGERERERERGRNIYIERERDQEREQEKKM